MDPLQKFQNDTARESAVEINTQSARQLLAALLAHEAGRLDQVTAALAGAQFEISVETRLSKNATTLLWLHEPGRDKRLLFACVSEPRADA